MPDTITETDTIAAIEVRLAEDIESMDGEPGRLTAVERAGYMLQLARRHRERGDHYQADAMFVAALEAIHADHYGCMDEPASPDDKLALAYSLFLYGDFEAADLTFYNSLHQSRGRRLFLAIIRWSLLTNHKHRRRYMLAC